jgi:hypothetical protein
MRFIDARPLTPYAARAAIIMTPRCSPRITEARPLTHYAVGAAIIMTPHYSPRVTETKGNMRKDTKAKQIA